MTGGALTQLIAYGAQDVYLTGNPQITFFKLVYRRHTNFSMEYIQQKSTNSSDKFGNKFDVIIQRVGDLLGQCYVEITVPALLQVQPATDINTGLQTTTTAVGFCDGFGLAVCRVMEFWIGGQLIDRQYGDWLDIWAELTIDNSRQWGYNQMVGKYDGTDVALSTNARPYDCKKDYTFMVPLQFWFCRNPGCYLPLIALQYHEVKICIDTRAPSELIRSFPETAVVRQPLDWNGRPWNATAIQVWSNYVYLDTDERRKFAQLNHEMLIEQVQFNTPIGIPNGSGHVNFSMEFNHPLKELMWVVPSEFECGNSAIGNDYFNYTGAYEIGPNYPPIIEAFSKATLLLNGQERFDERPAEYFRLLQPFEYHTRSPKKLIYVYSFALKPEEIQPSGTCNASRIDSFTLKMSFGQNCCAAVSRVLRVYSTNYNILRIMSGMGGLAFSN